MIRYIAMPVIAAALMASLPAGCGTTGPATTQAPTLKGDPGVPPEYYPTEMAPDPRTNGAWMVKAIRTDGPGEYSVMCWINSDESTLTKVDIKHALYEEYLANPDTGSIPCPEVPR